MDHLTESSCWTRDHWRTKVLYGLVRVLVVIEMRTTARGWNALTRTNRLAAAVVRPAVVAFGSGKADRTSMKYPEEKRNVD